jgi:hypothetical protein
LSHDGSQYLLPDRVENLLLIVFAEQLVDLWQLFGNGLLQYPE